jgi:hypothetical protein
MDFKRLANRAKRVIDDRGGTERLKQDAERLRGIATGPGTAKDKAKAAGEALKQPAGTERTEAERREPSAGVDPTPDPHRPVDPAPHPPRQGRD